MRFPVIDLFAGPGGLGEGFSAASSPAGRAFFRVNLSIEKDVHAHRTLELRAFFREYPRGHVPREYYDYLQGAVDRDVLFRRHPKQAAAARSKAWLAELGKTSNADVDRRITDALRGEERWVLIGGPPCQAYSLVGRSRIMGESLGRYEADPRHFLYKEYLRILAKHRPPVFIMENVKGLLSSRVNEQSTFSQILADLKSPLAGPAADPSDPLGYRLFSVAAPRDPRMNQTQPSDFIVRAEDYGVPQARHRLIILGIRSDVRFAAPDLLVRSVNAAIEDVIADLPKLRSGLSRGEDNGALWGESIRSVTQSTWLKSVNPALRRELKRIVKQIEPALGRGSPYIHHVRAPRKYRDWYIDRRLSGVCNHESRTHIRNDLHRYFFAAVFAEIYQRTPTLADFPAELLPEHANVAEALRTPKFNDRFRVQLRGRPATTITAHISKDGHYYIHYDPKQCRSLTVREAARLQTFPDNYLFEGNRTSQYHQVGNAVPPLLALQIANVVARILKRSR